MLFESVIRPLMIIATGIYSGVISTLASKNVGGGIEIAKSAF
jgi:hypothetical protein